MILLCTVVWLVCLPNFDLLLINKDRKIIVNPLEDLDEDEKFELDEGKKYFIRFPKPVGDKNYLVLNFKEKLYKYKLYL